MYLYTYILIYIYVYLLFFYNLFNVLKNYLFKSIIITYACKLLILII